MLPFPYPQEKANAFRQRLSERAVRGASFFSDGVVKYMALKKPNHYIYQPGIGPNPLNYPAAGFRRA